MDERFVGELSPADGVGEVGLGAEEAGKRLAVRFSLRLCAQQIEEIRFKVFGCGFTIAACAAAANLAQGQPVTQVRTIDARMIDTALDGLPAERSYCAELAAEALQAAVSSADKDGAVVQSTHQDDDHGPRITEHHPVYRLLMESPAPDNAPREDRRLFAGLLALAADEPYFLSQAVGLDKGQVRILLARYFPQVNLDNLLFLSAHATSLAPEINAEVRGILHEHVPLNELNQPDQTASWLADILAARAAHPGHLWVAMGLFERPELTAAIRRHLPTLAAANNRKMRWKRFLFKQVCELNGGVMCKNPNCGDCSDYALCFTE